MTDAPVSTQVSTTTADSAPKAPKGIFLGGRPLAEVTSAQGKASTRAALASLATQGAQDAPEGATAPREAASDAPDAVSEGDAKQKFKIDLYGKEEEREFSAKEIRDALSKQAAGESKLNEAKKLVDDARKASTEAQAVKDQTRNLLLHAGKSPEAFGDFVETIAKVSNQPQLVEHMINYVVALANEHALPDEQRRQKQEAREIRKQREEIDAWKANQAQQEQSSALTKLTADVGEYVPKLLQHHGLPASQAVQYDLYRVATMLNQEGMDLQNSLITAAQRLRADYERTGIVAKPAAPAVKRATPETVKSNLQPAAGRRKASQYQSLSQYRRR